MIYLKYNICILILTSLLSNFSFALSPPEIDVNPKSIYSSISDEERKKRQEFAKSLGNHYMSQELIQRQQQLNSKNYKRNNLLKRKELMPSKGKVKMAIFLISFNDYPNKVSKTDVEKIVNENKDENSYPYESLKEYYLRSSFGKLNIEPHVFDWYKINQPRSNFSASFDRRKIISEVVTHYNNLGHDFSQYDSNNDGVIDSIMFVWTGPTKGWGSMWWPYVASYGKSPILDGKRINNYIWHHETKSPRVMIHETGHLLGLPDLYDYDKAIGPKGGTGGIGMMSHNNGDIHPYFKWLLGWSTPMIENNQDKSFDLYPSSIKSSDSMYVLGNNISQNNPFGELLLIEHRASSGNDSKQHKNSGVFVWHINSQVTSAGHLSNNNSYTEKKLIKLVEADGRNDIENGFNYSSDDFFQTNTFLTNQSQPNIPFGVKNDENFIIKMLDVNHFNNFSIVYVGEKSGDAAINRTDLSPILNLLLLD